MGPRALALLVCFVSWGVLVGASASTQLADSPWPTPSHDLQNSRHSSHSGPPSPVGARWMLETEGDVRLPVIGPDGDVYAGAGSSVYRISSDGTTRWRAETCGTVSSLSIGADGVIYAGDSEGTVYALAPDGSKKWQFGEADRRLVTTAPGPDGTIYAASEEGLYALREDGSLKWRFEGEGELFPFPAVSDDGTVYVGTEGALTAIGPEGSKEWTVAVDGTPTPTVEDDGSIYVNSAKELLDVRPDGTVENRIDLKGPLAILLGTGPDGTIYAYTRHRALLALRPDGSMKWNYDVKGGRPTFPAVGADGSVIVGAGDGTVYALRPDGKVQWRFNTGGAVDSPPILGEDGTVYVGSNNHRLYRLGTVDHADGSPQIAVSTDTVALAVKEYSGQYSGSHTLTVRNEGTAPLKGHIAVRDSGAFSVGDGGGAYRLKPGAARAVTIKVRSREGPEGTGVLSVQHNGADRKTPVDIPLRSHESPSIYVAPDQQPTLSGGMNALKDVVQYPEVPAANQVDGKVFVEFVVDRTGAVNNAKVRRTTGAISSDSLPCDVASKFHEEAIRAIEKQSFAPGKQEGKTVNVEMSLPVAFEAPGNE